MTKLKEIKFRAWDKKEKEMIYFSSGALVGIGKDGYSKYFNLGLEDINADLDGGTPFGDILMQFTGLKDKNGKEIYEIVLSKTQMKNKKLVNGFKSGGMEVVENKQTNKPESDWGKEFDKVWNSDEVSKSNSFYAYGIIKDFIRSLLEQARQEGIEALEEILKEGSGGGNWRRIISLKISELKKKEGIK